MHELERSQIRDVVFQAIDRVKGLLVDESALAADESVVLLGEGTGLDSMGFVNFIVAVEEEMTVSTGVPCELVERVSSPDTDILTISTVGRFIDFLHGGSRS